MNRLYDGAGRGRAAQSKIADSARSAPPDAEKVRRPGPKIIPARNRG